MLIMLLLILEKIFDYPVFSYCTTRMALAAITSLLFTIIFGKPFIKKLYEWKIGDQVRSEQCPLLGELHRDKNHTPTMGGILIIASLLLSLILWMDPKSPFTLILFSTTIVIGLLGGIDDYLKLRYKNKKGLTGKKKMFVQLGFAALLSLYLSWTPAQEALHNGSWFAPPQARVESEQLSTRQYAELFYVPFFKKPLFHMSLFVMLLFFMVVITGTSNAVNLTDGLDGLATGTVMLASATFAILAFLSNHLDIATYLNIIYIEGAGEVAVYLSAITGASLGFLWYNSHPAQVFMGDTGALTLGAILGVSAVLLKREVLLTVVGGVFVAEALSVMLQVGSFKLRNKKRIFLCAPLHHHFEYKGWPETKVVTRFWIAGLLLAIIGMATLKFQ